MDFHWQRIGKGVCSPRVTFRLEIQVLERSGENGFLSDRVTAENHSVKEWREELPRTES